MVAQLVGARHSARLVSLVLGCTTLSVLRPIDGPPTILNPALALPPPTTPEGVRTLVETLLGGNYTPEWVASNPAYFTHLVDQALLWMRSHLTTMQQQRAIGRFDGATTCGALAALPVLLVHGTKDGVIPVAQARVLATHLPHAELILLQDAGHLFHTQAEEETNRALPAFLEKHEPKLTESGATSKL